MGRTGFGIPDQLSLRSSSVGRRDEGNGLVSQRPCAAPPTRTRAGSPRVKPDAPP